AGAGDEPLTEAEPARLAGLEEEGRAPVDRGAPPLPHGGERVGVAADVGLSAARDERERQGQPDRDADRDPPASHDTTVNEPGAKSAPSQMKRAWSSTRP